MSKMLNLVDCLLTRARGLQEIGRPQDALPILRRLSRFPGLSIATGSEILQLLGESCLELRDFRAARKHLRQLIRIEPHNAYAHHLLALAIENDAECDAAKASRHHRRAIELAPNCGDFLAAAGAYFANLGQVRKGIELLRRAWELAPDDFDIFKSLVESLCENAQFVDARRTLGVAQFRHGRDGRFAAISTDIELRELHHQRRTANQDQAANRLHEPTILPFNDTVANSPKPVRAYRRDVGRTRIQRPHLLRRYDAEQA